ncbi:hypothetical protein GCM10027168_10870 [Streptomyces capparidis]
MTLGAETALRWVEVLAGIGAVISCAEFLARPALTDDTSLAGWPLLRLRGRGWAACGDAVFAHPRVLVLQGLRMAAALAVVVWPLRGAPHTAALGTVAVTSVLWMVRGPSGSEGADHLLAITFTALALTSAHPTPGVMRLGLWFLTGQAVVAYFTSGIYKAASRVWRDGSGLTGILGTRAWGSPRPAVWCTAHPAAAAWASRGVICAETCFPLVLLAPSAALPALLAGGVLFHLVCAAVMGLNVFVWAFTATYPAITYTALAW